MPATTSSATSLTNRAVVAGYEGHDGSPLWVIRARLEGELIPGKLAIKHHGAYVPWDGKENVVHSFEVIINAFHKTDKHRISLTAILHYNADEM